MKRSFLDIFSELQKYVLQIDKECFKEISHFAFQFEICGEGEGIFYIEYTDNNLYIKPYDYRDYTACFQATADIYIRLFSGKLTISSAIQYGEINVINRSEDSLKNVITFFEACIFSKSVYGNEGKRNTGNENTLSTDPWENLRLYIEQLEIDQESKTQLLANLVRFTSNELHILIVGGSGCGKSSTINALFDMDIAEVGYGVDPKTQYVNAYRLDNLFLHDTPGLGENPEADKGHIKKIIAALREVDTNGNAVIDIVLVIVDGSNRDMSSSFELINQVIIPNLQHKDRILVAINRCDLALDGEGWSLKYCYPNEKLLQRLEEKAESVKKRIKDGTGVEVDPIFYSAKYKYNISKLLSYLIKSAPVKKRVFFAEKINKDEKNFLRDDTVELIKKNNINNAKKGERVNRRSSNSVKINKENSINASNLYEQVNDIKNTVTGIEKQVSTIQQNIKINDISNLQKKQRKEEIRVQDESEMDYELITSNKPNYKEQIKGDMKEAFDSVSEEISKGSKVKLKISFGEILNSVKEGARAGAETGRIIGENIPLIGASVGGAVGVVIGGVGGLFAGLFGKQK